jgi:DNA-binding transcriptional LysR family regulator
MRITPLPPLQYLVAFEAAVRLGSFTRAAAELHVTQGAVSRQIQLLEEFLGRSMFVRANRSLKLTTAGQRYAEEVAAVLAECADATLRVMKRPGSMELCVACPTGLSALWLTPRLPSFCSAHPDVNLRLIVRDDPTSLSPGEFDVGIYYSRNDPPAQYTARKIFNEEIVPACAPAYAGSRDIGLDDLPNEKLLMLDDSLRPWITWPEWFSLKGGKIPKEGLKATMSNSYVQLIQLAVLGQGIMLAWRPMIDPLFESGALCRVTDQSARRGGAYYVLNASDRMQNLAGRIFTKWLFEQEGIAKS